jgi:primosomal protein N' (replication factor Y) (superfamily II helicase)
MPYVEVAVDTPSGRPTYSYGVPEGIDVRPGQLVWVPFGTRTVRGVIVAVGSQPEHEVTRAIIAVSSEYELSPRQLELASFISVHYASSLFAALSPFLPPGVQRQPEVSYESAGVSEPSLGGLSSREAEIVRRVVQLGTVTLTRLRKVDAGSDGRAVLESLARKGLLLRHEGPREGRVRARTEVVVSLCGGPEETATELVALKKVRAGRQAQVVEHLIRTGGVSTARELRDAAGATPATLRSLAARGVVTLEERRVWRETLSSRVGVEPRIPVLTDAQAKALESITTGLDTGEYSESLLFGVTGSGKTEVYVRAAGHVLAGGRRVICLVPEIALTAQIVERFASRFPGRIALLHSGLTPGQQLDEWERIKQGHADIVIGPRSALFAPVERLGLIVIDEEHEWTYKQDDVAPRYHAREVARELARAAGAVLLLGSATPDVETFYRASSGVMNLLELPQRIGSGAGLPPVEVVDMRDELRSGNYDIFSRPLRAAMSAALSRGEQVLLFLNRRGTATLVQCRHCGHVFTCPRCSVALAHHAERASLLCHRCGYTAPVPQRCPQCRSAQIRFLGIGTQRVVEQVRTAFPTARVIRWDSDIPAGVRGGSELQDVVRGGLVDVIVGTQMVAKGHDFPNVTLVGVISADVGLSVPDYRSSERVFQLISQASGRAGRGMKPGCVVVQTYEPENYVILSAALHDYRAFYEAEIRYRQEAFYPPFCTIVRLVYSHSNEDRCRLEAGRVHGMLERRIASTDLRLTGPSPAFVNRLRGRYRWHLTVRGTAPANALADLSLPRGWVVDVEPASVA